MCIWILPLTPLPTPFKEHATASLSVQKGSEMCTTELLQPIQSSTVRSRAELSLDQQHSSELINLWGCWLLNATEIPWLFVTQHYCGNGWLIQHTTVLKFLFKSQYSYISQNHFFPHFWRHSPPWIFQEQPNLCGLNGDCSGVLPNAGNGWTGEWESAHYCYCCLSPLDVAIEDYQVWSYKYLWYYCWCRFLN